MKINLGCGNSHKPGWVNIDKKQPADVIADLTLGIPYDDNTFDEAYCDGLLEQLGDKFMFVLNEIHRVLKPDGIFNGVCPDATKPTGFQDPETNRYFVKDTFTYFDYRELHYGRYAKSYGYKPWIVIEVVQTPNGLLKFNMQPYKENI